jgi:hypothetical protein
MERKHFLYVLATTTLSFLMFPLLFVRKLTSAERPQDTLPLKTQKDPRAIGQKPDTHYTCNHCYTPHA